MTKELCALSFEAWAVPRFVAAGTGIQTSNGRSFERSIFVPAARSESG
jgi:hypothetical protein